MPGFLWLLTGVIIGAIVAYAVGHQAIRLAGRRALEYRRLWLAERNARSADAVEGVDWGPRAVTPFPPHDQALKDYFEGLD